MDEAKVLDELGALRSLAAPRPAHHKVHCVLRVRIRRAAACRPSLTVAGVGVADRGRSRGDHVGRTLRHRAPGAHGRQAQLVRLRDEQRQHELPHGTLRHKAHESPAWRRGRATPRRTRPSPHRWRWPMADVVARGGIGRLR
eukprot:5909805-Prymnesium_polylepis.1